MDKNLKKIEFDKVLSLISEHAKTSFGRKRILSMEPFLPADISTAQTQLNDVVEFSTKISLVSFPSISANEDLPEWFLLAHKGSVLTIKDLNQIRQFIDSCNRVRSWQANFLTDTSPTFTGLSEAIADYSNIARDIERSFISDEEVDDHASAELYRIRNKIKSEERKIQTQLDKILRSSNASFLQENVVTLRGGRYVVPVKVEHRASVPGLVHDYSSSGNTVFIEPASVVEANNEIMQLHAEEEREIMRILADFSAKIGNSYSQMKSNLEILITFDFYFALARFCIDFNCSAPILNTKGQLSLISARHPLISKDKVVPITISLGSDYHLLVITGPNTGGKTVTLKTVGLLVTLASSGIPIPADSSSEVAMYDSVLVDIGDEQSIEQSLSTFSAHITNVNEIIKAAKKNSLILLDELGSGTDPVEGAALAEAILNHFRETGCSVLATSHYSEIKLYAMQTEDVENASCEFDVNTLSPTYRILIGVPGKSNALAICERLDFSKEIISQAQSIMTGEQRRFEDSIHEIDELRNQLSRSIDEANALKSDAETELKRAREEAKQITNKANQYLSGAETKAKQVSADVTATANKLMDELRKIRSDESLSTSEKMSKTRKVIRQDISSDSSFLEKQSSIEELPPLEKIVIGESAYVISLNISATILSLPDEKGNVEVQNGAMKMRVQQSDLRQLTSENKRSNKRISQRHSTAYSARKALDDTMKSDADVRGMTVDEAILTIEGVIDRATLSGLHFVHIIHGKGTGALRKGIHEWLRKYPSVKQYRIGEYGEGDAGVTIVEIK